jgi:hypothetical protein
MTTTQKYDGRVHAAEIALNAGEVHLYTDFPSTGKATLTVHPDEGVTVYVSLVTSQASRIADGTYRCSMAGIGQEGATPDGKPAGVVTVAGAGMVLEAPVTAVRLLAVGGSAIVEVVQ